MSRLEKFMLWLAVLYILDVATTAVGLHLGAIEVNPIMAWLRPDLASLLKMTGLKALSLIGVFLISRRLIRIGSAVGTYRLHTAIIFLMLVVVVWNTLTIVKLIF